MPKWSARHECPNAVLVLPLSSMIHYYRVHDFSGQRFWPNTAHFEITPLINKVQRFKFNSSVVHCTLKWSTAPHQTNHNKEKLEKKIP